MRCRQIFRYKKHKHAVLRSIVVVQFPLFRNSVQHCEGLMPCRHEISQTPRNPKIRFCCQFSQYIPDSCVLKLFRSPPGVERERIKAILGKLTTLANNSANLVLVISSKSPCVLLFSICFTSGSRVVLKGLSCWPNTKERRKRSWSA